jgi:hypothetical protein
MVKHTRSAKPAAKPGKKDKKAAKKTAPGKTNDPHAPSLIIERIQTGVRLEKRVLKVLKGLAELRDLSLGDLIEGIVLHAFDGKAPFSAETLAKIGELKRIYGLDLDATASHRLRESKPEGGG